MVVIVGILAAAIVMIMLEVPTLRKQKMKKELWVFSILMLVAVGLSIAMGLQIDIPNPVDGITMLYKPFSDFVFHFLK
ncbi:hypothetical protein L1N85_15360 [Paenibacillus alkaliterrae]|uniref:hypothetical protein n=1 Tax=Paenibacillus alkaliterrae TaxID=320909 RepID=UPI001F46BAAA|nr:hypothetical protein [Paenibacillus alkaliterrae]MCF2939798.1 hypothetical protein [Paenibacillus alkaliterrae]